MLEAEVEVLKAKLEEVLQVDGVEGVSDDDSEGSISVSSSLLGGEIFQEQLDAVGRELDQKPSLYFPEVHGGLFRSL